MILTRRLGNKIGFLLFIFSLFFLSCTTSKLGALATHQEIYDTLISFGYKNKTLNYGFLTWKGFEFDSSLTKIPQLAKLYPEYKLISFANFRNQKRISCAYYFTFRTQMLVFALPLVDNPKNVMLKRKKQLKGKKYPILSEDIYLQDKHPMYALSYNQFTKKDTFYCCEFYVNAPKHTLRFVFFKITPGFYSKGYESYIAFSMMMKSFHWLGEKYFYDFFKGN